MVYNYIFNIIDNIGYINTILYLIFAYLIYYFLSNSFIFITIFIFGIIFGFYISSKISFKYFV